MTFGNNLNGVLNIIGMFIVGAGISPLVVGTNNNKKKNCIRKLKVGQAPPNSLAFMNPMAVKKRDDDTSLNY